MTQQPREPEFLSIDEAAALLRVNRKTLYGAAERGELRGVVRVGRVLRVRRSALFTDPAEKESAA